jgi:hypothetical protein
MAALRVGVGIAVADRPPVGDRAVEALLIRRSLPSVNWPAASVWVEGPTSEVT